MGRYALVASYYNIKTKRYENKVEVKVDGYDFSKLEDIDKFSLGNSKSNMWNIIRNQNSVDGRNFLSIRYIENNRTDPIYYMVIHDNKDLLSCVNDLALGYGSQGKYTYLINNNNLFFQSERKKLVDIIERRDYEMIDTLVGKRGNLRFLIDRYLSSDYDFGDQEKKNLDMRDIFLEFSRYKTFRGWVVNNKKMNEKRRYTDNRNVLVNRNIQNNRNNQGNVFKYKEIDVSEFAVDDVESLYKYNISNEEFLDEHEFEETGYVPSKEEFLEDFGDLGKRKRR